MEINHLSKEAANVLKDIAELGNCLWLKGWAERNAGNISVNIHESLGKEMREDLEKQPGPYLELDHSFPAIAGCFFLVTGTGKRMRELAVNPEDNALLIRVSETGKACQVISLTTSEPACKPTSELSSHLAIHEQLYKTGAPERSVVHTHPTELISLTQIRQFCDEKTLNELLWGMHPETMIFLPGGAGFLPYMLPGSHESAEATLEKFRSHKVIIWEKHGCFAIGNDVFEAFDLIDTLNKSALIYLQCRAAGHEPEGLSKEKLAELKVLSSKFLSR